MKFQHKATVVLLLTLVAIFFSSSQALAAEAPQVSSISPTSGPMDGGTLVTISGTGFLVGAAVYFGGNEALEVYFRSSTRLEVKVPASLVTGKVDIKVVNPDGQQGIKLDGFLYEPMVTGATTAEGHTGSTVGGQAVTITGSGFQNGLALYIGNNPATAVTVSSNGKTITALTPPGTVGKVAIKVVNPDNGTGILPATDENTFEYRLSQPQVTSVSPDRGTWMGGTEVTIKGQELSPTAVVRFGGIPATIKQANGITELVVITPRGTVGEQDVTVTNPDGQTSLVTAESKFEFLITPVVESITPNYGSPLGGTEVTIAGSNFPALDSLGVTFGGREASIEEVNPDNIIVTTPAGAPGPVDVKVYDKSDPDKAYIVNQGFTYISDVSNPIITGISPNSGSKGGGTAVTITGSDFRSGFEVPLKVKFGDNYATQVTVKSTTELLVTTPPSPITGPVDVTVENPDGGKATLADGFTYLAPERVLLITGVTPNQGSMEGNTPITVNGANFVDPGDAGVVSIELTIGGNLVRGLSWDPVNKAYRAFTPPGFGTQDVVLVIKRQQQGDLITEKAILPAGYTYRIPESKPKIIKVEPNGGPLSGGTLITITGSDFRAPGAGETVQVYIGSLPATQVQVLDSEHITAVTPPSPGTGVRDVIVINPDLATAVLPNAFTYVASAMTIVSVTPDKGPVDSPTRITITGANFNQDSDELGNVYIVVEIGTEEEGYLPASGVVVSPDGSTITAYTPVHTAGSKDVVVRNRFGSVSLSQAFTYFVPSSSPAITGINPALGPTTGGTPFTIYGERFQSGAIVTIGGVPATQVQVIDIDTIRALTPPGQPGPQDVVVTNPDGGQAALPDGFTYISSPLLDSVSPGRGSVAGGTVVTLSGADFYPGMQVYFGSVTDVVYGTVTGEAYQQVPPGDIIVIDRQTARVRLPAWLDGIDPEKGLKVDIALVNSDALLSKDGGYVIAKNIFTYCQPLTFPRIEQVTPGFGPVQGGNEVLITGSGFQPDAVVFFGWEEARVLEVTPNQIRVSAPANSPGFYDVTVINTYDTGLFIKENAYEYRQPLTSPRITGVFPSYGPAAGGTLLAISGDYFWPGVRVFIGTGEAFLYVDNDGNIAPKEQAARTVPPLVASGGKIIYVHTPEGPKAGDSYLVGPVDVNIVNPDGGSATLRQGFTYKLPDSHPVITSLTPAIGTTRGGTPVTITGIDFRLEVQVYFDGIKATVKTINPTSIEVVTPAHDPGLVDVTVVNKDGGVATAYRAFEYRLPGSEPLIKWVEPNVGSVIGGTRVTISGEDFRDGVKVYFAGQEALEVVRVDYQTVTAVTPPGEAGRVDITVVNPDAGTFTLSGGFTYQSSVPRIEAVMPERGPREGGIKVIIRGNDFMAPVQAYFGSELATGETVTEGGTVVEVILPPAKDGRLGVVDVKVINGDGAVALLPKSFTYVVPDSQPVITSIDPAAGSTLGGNWVTITGEDFREDPQVFIGSQLALEVKLVNSQTMRVKMPPHSEGPKDVMVVNYDGGTGILLAGYTYKIPESQPVINKIEPSRGPHVGGTAVTVTGLDFRAGAELYIGGAPAREVRRVDYRTITAVTPPGTVGKADVTVVNPDLGACTLTQGFTYYYVEAPIISSVSPNEGPAGGGTEIGISGSKFAKNVNVFIGGVAAEKVERVSDSLIKAVTPSGDAGWQEVRVVNDDGGWSSLAQGFCYLKPRGAPAAPSWFMAAVVDDETIKLRWGAAEFADYYEIWSSRHPGGDYRFLARTPATTFYSEALPAEAGYFFRVRAVNEFGYSAFTDEEYAEAEAKDETDSGYEKSGVQIKTNSGAVEVTLDQERLLSRDYSLDLASNQYSGYKQYLIRVAAGTARRADGTLNLRIGDLSLAIPASALRDVYRSHLAGDDGRDAWVEVILKDRGQGEAEAALKELPRGARVISRVWGIKLQGRQGRHIYPQLYFPTGVVLAFVAPPAETKSPVMYSNIPYNNTWQPVTTLHAAQVAQLRFPGKYVLVDRGGL